MFLFFLFSLQSWFCVCLLKCGKVLANFLSSTKGSSISPFPRETTYIDVFGGSLTTLDGKAGLESLMLYPVGVWMDSQSNLYYSEQGNCVIRRLTRNGLIETLADNQLCGNNGDHLFGNETQLGRVGKMIVLRSGAILWTETDTGLIRSFGLDHRVETTAGMLYKTKAIDGVFGNQTGFSSPQSLWMDEDKGLLYIADTMNYRIRLLNNTSHLITTIAGIGESGYSGDYSLATKAAIGSITDLQGDGQGNLYFLDSRYHLLRSIDATGIIYTLTSGIDATGGFYFSEKLQTFFIAQRTRQTVIQLELTNPKAVTTILGSRTAGLSPITFSNASMTSLKLYFPSDVFYDETQAVLYTLESGSRGLLSRYSPLSNTWERVIGATTSAENGSSPATSAILFRPQHLWQDEMGTVYFTDSGVRGVRYVSQGKIYSLPMSLEAPYGITGDSSANVLYISDPVTHAVYRYSLMTSQLDIIVGAVGSADCADSQMEPGGRLDTPLGLWRNETSQELWIADPVCGLFTMTDQKKVIWWTEMIEYDLTALWGDVKTGRLYGTSAAGMEVYELFPVEKKAVSLGGHQSLYWGSLPVAGINASLVDFLGPTGIAGDTAGNLYIADTNACVVQMLTPSAESGEFVARTIAGNGTFNRGGVLLNGIATEVPWNTVLGIWINKNGTLYVSDGLNIIYEITSHS